MCCGAFMHSQVTAHSRPASLSEHVRVYLCHLALPLRMRNLCHALPTQIALGVCACRFVLFSFPFLLTCEGLSPGFFCYLISELLNSKHERNEVLNMV